MVYGWSYRQHLLFRGSPPECDLIWSDGEIIIHGKEVSNEYEVGIT